MQNLTPNAIFANDYTLVQQLGLGGFAEVWEAEYTKTGERVALKIFIRLDNDGIEEAKQEFRTSIGLSHSHIIKVRHFDIWEGQPFLVMALYSKGNTVKLINKVDEQQIALLIYQVAQALDYLHSQEPPIIHRDIKPDNILVDVQDNYHLSDLGISQKLRRTMTRSVAANRQTVKAPQQTGSTPMAYHAPELFNKESGSKKPIKAHDIFALGVTLFELTSGELPFGEFGGVLLNQNVETPDISDSYSKELNLLIASCLAKEPWERPTAQQLSEYAKGYLETGTWRITTTTQKMSKTTPQNQKIEKQRITKESTTPSSSKKSHVAILVAFILIMVASISFYFYRQYQQAQFIANHQKGNDFYQLASYDSTAFYFKKALTYYKVDSVSKKVKMLKALRPAMSDFYNANYEDAFQKLQVAADLGSGDAYYYLGELTYNGLGTVKDYKQGWQYTNKAADLGFKMAYWRIAVAYERGDEVEQDQNKADKYYLQAVEAMKKLADAGDPEALGNLGSMYASGSGVAENEAIGFEYYLKSAETGYAFVMSNLADMYQYGTGTDKDMDKAIEWYQKSADMGHPEAQLSLGNLYLKGEGVEKDSEKGVELIHKAADQNYSAALAKLGYLYYMGEVVEKDYDKSHQFTKKAVDFDNDNVVAMENLAYDYKKGIGIEKDFVKAKLYYAKALQTDSTRTQNYIRIAELYEMGGYGLGKSDKEYVQYCQLAEDNGNREGTRLLGNYYNSVGYDYFEEGKYSQAWRYFKLAKAKGNKKGKNNLGFMEKNGYR